MPYERAYIILSNGEVHVSDGTKENVSLAGLDLNGAVITHNHPANELGQSNSFGHDDFDVIQNNPNIAELRLINDRYLYILKPINVKFSINEAWRNGLELMSEDGVAKDQQHYMNVWLRQEGYIEYVRINRATKERD